MDSKKDQYELSEENLNFILDMVDRDGGNDENDEISMTMDMDGVADDEGDDDVFENVLINSCNFCQNKRALGDNGSPSVFNSDNVTMRSNENKENDDHVIPIDRHNNSNNNYQTFRNMTSGSNNSGSNIATSNFIFSDETKFSHNHHRNHANNDDNNNNIDWSSFDDFNFPDNALLLNGSSSSSSNTNNADKKCELSSQSFRLSQRNSSSNNNADKKCELPSQSFRLSQRNSSSSDSSSRNASSSSSSINNDACSGSSRNSSCSSLCGVASTANTVTTTTNNSDSSSSSEVMTAYMEACRSGQLTPILKEELKFFIQARRLSQGKEEMEVQFLPPSPSQLSAKELEKIERRKRQNRQAAKRFREKQKGCEGVLLQRIKELESVNTALFQEAQVLKGEKQKLMEVMAEHLLVCPSFSQSALNLIGR